jgi:hypothetical protein
LEEGTLEEEGVQLAVRSCSGHIDLMTVSVERKHTRENCGARVSPSDLQGERVLHYGG